MTPTRFAALPETVLPASGQGLTWAILGAVILSLLSLLGLVIRAIVTGRLVPRATLDDWVSAYRTSEEARTEERSQTEELLSLARTTNQAITAIASRATL